MYILSYEKFNEAVLLDTKTNIDISFIVNVDNHYYDRLSRTNTEVDMDGYPITNIDIIDPIDVENDIKKAMNDIALKNLFNNGIYWIKDYLNKELLITNIKTDLNIVLIAKKEKNNKEYKYNLTVKTIMRKKEFIPSHKENTFQIKIE